MLPTIYPASVKEQGGAAQPLLLGSRAATATSGTSRPWKNNQDLYVLKDDFSAVFGKHFVKAGAVPAARNAKNEEVDNTSQESVQFGGAGRLSSLPPATSPA